MIRHKIESIMSELCTTKPDNWKQSGEKSEKQKYKILDKTPFSFNIQTQKFFKKSPMINQHIPSFEQELYILLSCLLQKTTHPPDDCNSW